MGITLIRRYPIAAAATLGMVGGLLALFPFRVPAVAQAIFFATLVGAGAPLVIRTAAGLIRGRFAADVVATLAIVTAVILGEYFAGTVIVLMQSGGEALEDYALKRASMSVEALVARAPKLARRLVDGSMEEIAATEVRVGDLLVVRPGDLVPVDGEVVSGQSAVDQSALTGEPMPVHAEPGTELYSGGVNLDGALTLKAIRTAVESQYQQIVQLVERARLEKPPMERLADRAAVWFTPATLIMCGVAWLITSDPTAVLAVLVVATPCPLILATPVAVIAGINRAADRGVIIKTGSAIEQVGRAGVVVFDKTGTLTEGHPTLSSVRTFHRLPEHEVLKLAASVEQLTSHHLGTAVVAAARERNVPLAEPLEFDEHAGLGVHGRVDGRFVIVGTAGLLREHGVTVDAAPLDGTVAWVGVDGELVGALVFADRIRPEVPALMRQLRDLGIGHTVMLTGDRRENAEAVAAEVGIAEAHADLLPGDKVRVVGSLKREHGTVVMVGDGINDAPALAAAAVGIAMGAHAPAASSAAADIVLVVDDVSRVGDAITVGRRTRRVALQSIGIGMGVSFALMWVASFGHITPALGAVLQEILDVGVILNALRARRN